MSNPSQITEHTIQFTYTDLQKNVDELVGRYGLQKAVTILANFSSNTKIKVSNPQKLRLITDYIVAKCITIFDIEEEQLNNSTIREYREARMACYHVLSKYTDMSYARIAERFGWKYHNVFYFYHKCEEILSLPTYYKNFVTMYKALELSAINFISNLN